MSDGLIASSDSWVRYSILRLEGKQGPNKGGFFPTGLNGIINSSTGAAAAAKIAA